mmetsp:Transcript_63312/g.92781  ORF Transcript_63312/g.92781 Transcript_63312/m.92781 type:complete len:216 (-) Transcript_63312:367-1014(-)
MAVSASCARQWGRWSQDCGATVAHRWQAASRASWLSFPALLPLLRAVPQACTASQPASQGHRQCAMPKVKARHDSASFVKARHHSARRHWSRQHPAKQARLRAPWPASATQHIERAGSRPLSHPVPRAGRDARLGLAAPAPIGRGTLGPLEPVVATAACGAGAAASSGRLLPCTRQAPPPHRCPAARRARPCYSCVLEVMHERDTWQAGGRGHDS